MHLRGLGPRRLREAADDRGSVLALVPAGFLVLILLGGISVDSAVAYLGQRQLVDAVSGAANDAAGAALDGSTFYGRGALSIDPQLAGAVICRSLASQSDTDLHGMSVEIAVAGPVVRVRARAEIDAVFGRIIPGFGQRFVSGEAVAVATGAPAVGQPLPSSFSPLACS